MKYKKSLVTATMIVVASLHAGDRLEAVSVQSFQENLQREGQVKDIVEKTEVIGKKEIEKKQAANLVEAIEKSPGVSVTTNCSMCGIKRVMLNGMKGEHTTVLSDGVPLNSTVSSYYGMDALGVGDVESIEIARSSGASLTAPEAIGGTLNIVSRRAKKNSAEFNFAGGEQGYKLASFVGEGITQDKKTGVIISGMYSNYNQYDQDKNGVNEAPKLENRSVSIKLFHELTPSDLLDIKISHSNSDVFGGPMSGKSDAFAQFATTGSANPNFVGGDVRGRYNGDPMGTMESISTKRTELMGKWTHVAKGATIQTTLAYADAAQDSMYEGTDYDNKDKTLFADFKVSQPISQEHFFTYGMDIKQEIMRAMSSRFTPTSTSNGRDDFDYLSYGLYFQDTWTINEKTELNLALRGTKITTNFTGQFAKENEIDKTIVVPRLHLRYNHNEELTSRFSAGSGYRSPLTFFESEHGVIGSNGFAVNINNIERSNSAAYSLSYDNGSLSVSGNVAYTDVKNLATIDTSSAVPTLVNSEDRVAVRNADIVVGYALTPSLSISGGYEQYFYDTKYKDILYIAAVEKRAHFMVDWEKNGWDAMAEATWTGARDLAPYGYGDRFNDTALTSQKNTTSPAFTTVDLKISKELSKSLTFYVGVKNLFDYTQTAHESPLFYSASGSYDVGHIWGPLRGRMSYVGLKMTF